MANWADLGSPGTPPGGTNWLKRHVLPAGMLNISKQGQTEELCGDRTNHIQSHNVHIFKWTLQLLFRSNIQNPKLDFFFLFFFPLNHVCVILWNERFHLTMQLHGFLPLIQCLLSPQNMLLQRLTVISSLNLLTHLHCTNHHAHRYLKHL